MSTFEATHRDHIYVLARTDTRQVFYVGRTINPTRREVEHRYAATRGHEDKYAYIRNQLQGVEWELVVIKTIEPGEVVEDYEDWFVIQFLRAGQPLQNMRAGDARQAVAREMAESAEQFDTVEQVARWKRERAAAEAREAAPVCARHPKLAAFFAEHSREVAERRKKEGQRVERKAKRERECAEWVAQERARFDKERGLTK